MKTTKDEKITIGKLALFELLNSHSALLTREYNRNPRVNSSHYSYKAEIEILKHISEDDFQKWCCYSENNILEYDYCVEIKGE